jgi:hypothetical protein
MSINNHSQSSTEAQKATKLAREAAKQARGEAEPAGGDSPRDSLTGEKRSREESSINTEGSNGQKRQKIDEQGNFLINSFSSFANFFSPTNNPAENPAKPTTTPPKASQDNSRNAQENIFGSAFNWISKTFNGGESRNAINESQKPIKKDGKNLPNNQPKPKIPAKKNQSSNSPRKTPFEEKCQNIGNEFMKRFIKNLQKNKTPESIDSDQKILKAKYKAIITKLLEEKIDEMNKLTDEQLNAKISNSASLKPLNKLESDISKYLLSGRLNPTQDSYEKNLKKLEAEKSLMLYCESFFVEESFFQNLFEEKVEEISKLSLEPPKNNNSKSSAQDARTKSESDIAKLLLFQKDNSEPITEYYQQVPIIEALKKLKNSALTSTTQYYNKLLDDKGLTIKSTFDELTSEKTHEIKEAKTKMEDIKRLRAKGERDEMLADRARTDGLSQNITEGGSFERYGPAVLRKGDRRLPEKGGNWIFSNDQLEEIKEQNIKQALQREKKQEEIRLKVLEENRQKKLREIKEGRNPQLTSSQKDTIERAQKANRDLVAREVDALQNPFSQEPQGGWSERALSQYDYGMQHGSESKMLAHLKFVLREVGAMSDPEGGRSR